ncbi:MAG: hypothetical protein RJQ04_22280 [Longimicrobiales bacterium]
MANKPVVRTLFFLERLTRTPGFVGLLIKLLNEASPSLREAKFRILEDASRANGGLDTLHEAFSAYGPEGAEARVELEALLKDNLKEETTSAILEAEPNLLLGVTSNRSFPLSEVIGSTTEELLHSVRKREVRKFAFMSFRNRMDFLEKKLKIDLPAVLDWSLFTSETRQRLQSWNLDRIADVYELRHGIAHGDDSPGFESWEELRELGEVLSKIVLGITKECHRRGTTRTDWEVPMVEMLEHLRKSETVGLRDVGDSD